MYDRSLTTYRIPTIDTERTFLWQTDDRGRVRCRVPHCRLHVSLGWCTDVGHAEIHCTTHRWFTIEEQP